MSLGKDVREREIEVPLDPDGALDKLEAAAEAWGAEWHRRGTGGRLGVPVAAGLRSGWLESEVRTERSHGGTRVCFFAEKESYHLQASAVFVLILGAVCGLFLVVAPLLEKLVALAPIALLFVVLAWLLVASRLKNRSIDDYFDLFYGMATSHEPDTADDVGKKVSDGGEESLAR